MPNLPKKHGGQPGNVNNLQTGSQVRRLTVGNLPLSMIAVTREGLAYRREMEAAVVAAKGEISLTDAHHIDTASAATIQAAVCRWLLRNKIETKDEAGKVVDRMSSAEIRANLSDITKAKRERDAAVRLLKIDVPPTLNWVIDQ